MIKSKAIEIVKTFDENEFKELGKLVSSPFFNSNSKLCELYGILKINYPDFSKRGFTKEKVYSKLFPGKKYNDGTMRKLFSGIQTLAEEYLSHSALNSHYFEKKNLLLNKLDEKRLDVLFDQHLNETFEIYGQEGRLEDVYFKNYFEVFEIILSRKASSGVFYVEEELKCFFFLISHCIILALKMNQDIIVGSVGHPFDYKNTLLFKFTEKFDLKSYIDDIREYAPEFYPILKIYYLNFLILIDLDKDDNYFWEMKNLVWENIHRFSRFEKYNLMIFLENCASIKIRDGKNQFIEHIHEIQVKMLQDKTYVSDDNNYITVIRFWKIVGNALRLKKFDWTRNFIEEYSSKLEPASIEHMKNYSYAMLFFATGDFSKALEFATKTKPITYNIRYDLMVLKIKCCYELNLVEELFYHIDSFKHLLKNDSSPDWAKDRFQKFMTYFEKMLKLKENEDFEGLDLIEKEITQDREIFDPLWLKRKIEEIFSNN